MKVRILKTDKITEFNDSYAARLIEQGKAVIVKSEPIMPKPVEPKAEEKPAKKKG